MIVWVPEDAAAYVNVLAALELVQVNDVGVNVPPAPPSENVTTSVVVEEGMIVNAADATPTVPPAGPESVNGT